MADTQRSLADLQALLADNTSGDISPQDLRDALVSALGGYGGLYFAANAVAQTIGTLPAKLTGWAGELPSAGTTPAHATSDLTIAVAGDYAVRISVSGLADAARLVKLAVYLNGAAVTGAACVRKVATGTDVGSWCVESIVTCAVSDVLAVYASSDQAATSLTVQEGALTVKRVS